MLTAKEKIKSSNVGENIKCRFILKFRWGKIENDLFNHHEPTYAAGVSFSAHIWQQDRKCLHQWWAFPLKPEWQSPILQLRPMICRHKAGMFSLESNKYLEACWAWQKLKLAKAWFWSLTAASQTAAIPPAYNEPQPRPACCGFWKGRRQRLLIKSAF